MTEIPRFGQRSTTPRQEMCPKHPDRPAVAYCKRCNRPACSDCAIQTEVGAICVDCATKQKRASWTSRIAGGQLAGAPVTLALIIINVVLFIAQKIFPAVFQQLAMSPAAGYFEPWRLLTTAFLHAGIWHILFNMLMLFLLGSAVERAVGHWKFTAIYIFSALVGSLAVIGWVFVTPATLTQATIGASGAIYGLFGAIFIAQRRSGMPTSGIVTLLVINLVYGFIMPNVSWQAHVGGFLGGLLCTALYLWVMDKTRRDSNGRRTALEVAATVGLAVLIGAATWGTYAMLIPRFIG